MNNNTQQNDTNLENEGVAETALKDIARLLNLRINNVSQEELPNVVVSGVRRFKEQINNERLRNSGRDPQYGYEQFKSRYS